MSYIDYINAFERWLETNYLPSLAQLLYYKILGIFNRAGWSEWVTVDNCRLMALAQISSEKSLIKHRDILIENNLLEYQKGKKGKPNKYKLNTVNFTVYMTVETTVKREVKKTVETTAINRERDRLIDDYIYNILRTREDEITWNAWNDYAKQQFKVCKQVIIDLFDENRIDVLNNLTCEKMLDIYSYAQNANDPVAYMKSSIMKNGGYVH